MNDMAKYQTAREIWLQAQFDHENVLKLFAAWKEPQHIYICMEWAERVRMTLFLPQLQLRT